MALLRLFFDICLLRKGPQDLPVSRFLFYLTLIFYVATGFLLLMAAGWMMAATQIAAEFVLTGAFTYGILTFDRKKTRFVQTFTALLGTDAFIGLCAVPFSGAVSDPAKIGPADLLMSGLMLWHLVVTGHIFRHALSRSLGYGLGAALALIFVTYMIMNVLFMATG
ncbi:MAG: hypothetical protein ABFS02_09220 [Pseudomonadota bacterium]